LPGEFKLGLPFSFAGQFAPEMSEIEKSFSLDQIKVVTDMDGAVAERGAAAPASALPCLYSNTCTKQDELNVLSGSHKRTAFMVAFEIESMVNEFGIERIGFNK
jgi:hypothetical protein